MKRTRRSTVCLVFFVLLAGLWLVDAVETVVSLPFDVFGWAGRTVDRLSPTEARKAIRDQKDRKDKKDLKDRDHIGATLVMRSQAAVNKHFFSGSGTFFR